MGLGFNKTLSPDRQASRAVEARPRPFQTPWIAGTAQPGVTSRGDALNLSCAIPGLRETFQSLSEVQRRRVSEHSSHDPQAHWPRDEIIIFRARYPPKLHSGAIFPASDRDLNLPVSGEQRSFVSVGAMILWFAAETRLQTRSLRRTSLRAAPRLSRAEISTADQ